MNIKKTIEERPIAGLKPHPQQAKIFFDVPNAEIKALADDLSKNGLIQEIEILPDGTIICGHQRVRAAQMLGWTAIRCWVRDDLAEAGEAAVEKRLIEDNLNRRQLSKLDKARAYVRLKELAGNKSGIDVRDTLGGLLGMSGRNLDRWAKVLKMPLEVQHAVDRGKLTMAEAGKIADLPEAEQRAIADAIRSGKDATKVFLKCIATRKKNATPVAWIQSVARNLEKIKNQTDQRLESHGRDGKPFEEAIKTAQLIEKTLRAKQAEWQTTREQQAEFLAASEKIKRS